MGKCPQYCRAFAQYLNHLANGCQLLGIDRPRFNEEVRAIAEGLRIAHGLSFRFGDFTPRNALSEMITRESINSEFGQRFYLAYVGFFRVLPAGIPPRRGNITDGVGRRAP